MPVPGPSAYCFFQDLAPRPPLDAEFPRDYLLYAVKGALQVRVDEQHWVLPPSFAALIPAHTPMTVLIECPVTTCSVLVTPGLCSAFAAGPRAFQMSRLARLMIRHCKDWGQDAAHPPEAEGFFLSLLHVCAGLAEKSVEIRRPTALNPVVQRAIAETEARLDTDVTATLIARAVGTSDRSLQRRFREDVGLTWAQTLTRLRMIRAVALLAEQDRSILQISGDCGYASLSAFNRAFMAYAQTTPTEFRSRMRD